MFEKAILKGYKKAVNKVVYRIRFPDKINGIDLPKDGTHSF
jgi:hypothetical protein